MPVVRFDAGWGSARPQDIFLKFVAPNSAVAALSCCAFVFEHERKYCERGPRWWMS